MILTQPSQCFVLDISGNDLFALTRASAPRQSPQPHRLPTSGDAVTYERSQHAV